jgi:hypothetical protein
MMTTDKTKTMKRLTRVVTFVMFDNTIASLVIRRHSGGGVYN